MYMISGHVNTQGSAGDEIIKKSTEGQSQGRYLSNIKYRVGTGRGQKTGIKGSGRWVKQ